MSEPTLAQIEAAARAIVESAPYETGVEWAALSGPARIAFTDIARAALVAAAGAAPQEPDRVSGNTLEWLLGELLDIRAIWGQRKFTGSRTPTQAGELVSAEVSRLVGEIRTLLDATGAAPREPSEVHEPSHDRVYCVRCGGKWPCQEQPVRSLAEVVSRSIGSDCSYGVCLSGCSHLMWACSACSCEGGWGAPRADLERYAAEHVCPEPSAPVQVDEAKLAEVIAGVLDSAGIQTAMGEEWDVDSHEVVSIRDAVAEWLRGGQW